MEIPAGEFKTHCLKLMEQVKEKHCTYTITKRGKPVAMLVPVEDAEAVPVFGYLKGHARVNGDIVESTGEKWDADA